MPRIEELHNQAEFATPAERAAIVIVPADMAAELAAFIASLAARAAGPVATIAGSAS